MGHFIIQHRLKRKDHGKSSTLSWFTFYFNRAMLQVHQLLYNGKTKSAAAKTACGFSFSLAKTFEDVVHLFRQDTNARICNIEPEHHVFVGCGNGIHMQPHAAFLCKLDAVAQQVDQYLCQADGIAAEGIVNGLVYRYVKLQALAFGLIAEHDLY